MIDDEKRIITISEYLVQLVLKQSNGLIRIDEEFQKIIVQYHTNNKYIHTTAQMYESYIEFTSENVTFTFYVQTIVSTLLETVLNDQLMNNPLAPINIYQQLIEIILKYFEERKCIASIFKQITLQSAKK
ncbi:unnamed protein product [Rotaria sp. Silwood2]|nr:unnamed protein product [Rotaria sp. Silwood2]CAF2847063.1 unnamed protein product [Rotaria sp. Silwood2]CAF4121904.1 unnamed protein product [Rotaria sp. Silwood2]CAF4160909.1 unnamed protein product [Rotaria sp. Silwood2]